MRPYRQAGREKNPTNGLLRAVRQALRIPVPEIAAKMGVNRSVVFDLEAREPKNTITLKSMSRMAEAMGCMMVYGIVPVGGKTLDELAEERLWASLLGVGSEIRGQGSGVTDLNSLQKIAWFSDTLRADTPNETRGEGGRGSS
jgi:transcriptional regulator with XRE-family HTH domain